MHDAPPVSALYVALGALMLVVMSVRIITVRRRLKIGLGDGGERQLLQRMRVQGNAVETLPIQLLMLVMLEWMGVGHAWLHGFGVAIIASRTLHAVGLSRSPGTSFGRFVGTAISLLLMVLMSLALIVHTFIR